jgi:citrate synthase
MSRFYSAREAAAHLGVSTQTLYSYVSRGLLRAHASGLPRERRYRIDEVAQLAHRRSAARKPREVAKRALDWGLPVVESTICLISGGRLYYRGKDVLALAETCSLEEVAALLWECPAERAFARSAPRGGRSPWERTHQSSRASRRVANDPDALTSIWRSFAQARIDTAPAQGGREPGDLVRTLTACVLRAPVTVVPIHEQCAKAWRVSARGADLIRRALILCADHELNASSFTVRCVASTGASLHAALLAGLAALSGERHGGMTARVESLWKEAEGARNLDTVLRERLQRGEALPGFGHPLCPEGDVRASALLNRMAPRRATGQRLANAVEHVTGDKPSIDFALVALRRYLGLPEGAAFGLFALARSVGWIAHAREQRERGQLIRPRAAYTGPAPEH